MHLSIDLFNPPWHKTLMMVTLIACMYACLSSLLSKQVALLKKADVLFAVSTLSDGFFDNNEDRHAYMQVIKEYFADSGDEVEAETENKDGMIDKNICN